MDGRYIEPRKVMWAVAEITWEDDSGTSFRVPAILEDTSLSGACVRIKRPLTVGSRLVIKWHREQFPAIARNCRRDGADFLLGVRREAEIASATKSASHLAAKAEPTAENRPEAKHAITASAQTLLPAPFHRTESAPEAPKPTPSRPRKEINNQGTCPRPERKVMQTKTVFPHFWRRKRGRRRASKIPDHGGSNEQAQHTRTDPERSPR